MNSFNLMKKNIKYFFPLLLKITPLTVILIIINSILNSIATILWVFFPKLIVEELTGNKDLKKLSIIVVSFVLSELIINIIINIISNLVDYYTQKANFYIDQLFNNKIATIDYFNVEDPKFSDEVVYAKQCLNNYSNGIFSIIWSAKDMLSSLFTFIGIIGILFTSSLPWHFVVILFGLIILNSLFNNKINEGYLKQEENFNKLMIRTNRRLWHYNKNIFAFRTQKDLRIYDAKNLIDSYANKARDDYNFGNKRLTKELVKLNSFYNTFNYLISIYFVIALLIICSYKYSMTIAVFLLVYTSIQTINSSLDRFIYSYKSYLQTCVYQEHFIDLMHKESIFKDGTLEIKQIDSLEFKNVSFRYPRTEKYILKNVSFRMDNKEKVSLVGLNGSGKTTIIKLICRFYDVDDGEILVNNINIKKYKYEDYLQLMAVVFQDFKIISFNILDNIANLDRNREKFIDVLKRVQIFDKVESLPNKEHTYINKWFNKNGIEFSGGEMQKFAIARALYKNSDLVILDEPTSALDPEAEAKIYYHFNDIVGHKLCLFISHRLSSCIFCDKILVIDGNQIVEEGKHKDLMKNECGLYYKMFNSQAKYYKN